MAPAISSQIHCLPPPCANSGLSAESTAVPCLSRGSGARLAVGASALFVDLASRAGGSAKSPLSQLLPALATASRRFFLLNLIEK